MHTTMLHATVYSDTVNPWFNGLIGAKGCPLDWKFFKSRIF
jgi:hypothetical protein